MAKFEKVSKYANIDIIMPKRKTSQSAGYDMVAAEDIIIYPYNEMLKKMQEEFDSDILTLKDMASITKKLKTKPTLVSTGMKCKLEPDTYLELSLRSSSPLKYWIMMANSIGIIDADYYNNEDNEGEIFFQLYNMSPYPIKIQKGEAIGQGIIKHYLTTEDDESTGKRTGGFGSTTEGYTDQSAMMPAT